ncbi:hypothetical protein EYM_00125 [Ignicoccus islandicus DSM 13165]|uniref:Uncharacterized protein n=1 Tax=Ignicoccus islandicus DSM 13165 TaxID=940295 RepID=A0A0U3FP43_9CREN|nr:hypothetical protein [Ignicoccus islandicus]ALU12095.1 hypothetical protein EYM_00125 [Ignicoccus islandicus DSM 13165]
MITFIARVYRSKSKVVLAMSNGKVKVIELSIWNKYLSKCWTYGYAYLCKRSLILKYGDLVIGLVKKNEPPMPEDVEALMPLIEKLSFPHFVVDEVISLMYSRDTLLDLSCAGCEVSNLVPGKISVAEVA